MHTTHHHHPHPHHPHHHPPDHSRPLAKILTVFAVVLFAAGGYSSSVLSGLLSPAPVYVAHIPQNFPQGQQTVCNDRCSSQPDGGYKFCYPECVGPGISRSVGCDGNGFIVGKEEANDECSSYGTCAGSGHECVAACSEGTSSVPGFDCGSGQICCPKNADPGRRQLACSNACKTGPQGEKNHCYRECHPNKEGYKHDVFCINDGNGGAQWILENESPDSCCAAGTEWCDQNSPPPDGGNNPLPGGGNNPPPPDPGDEGKCVGDGYSCVPRSGRYCINIEEGIPAPNLKCDAANEVCCDTRNTDQENGNTNTNKSPCEQTGYTCMPNDLAFTYACSTPFELSTLDCKESNDICCTRPNPNNARMSRECAEKSEGNYKSIDGNSCYLCKGKIEYVYKENIYTWGYVMVGEHDSKYCMETPECRNQSSACTLKRSNICYYCHGYKYGESYGYKLAECPQWAKNGQCMTPQDVMRNRTYCIRHPELDSCM